MSTETVSIDREGKKMGMWLFLFTEILFFGGMFLLYAVFRHRFPADFHRGAAGESLVLGTVNTAVLLTSSFTIALAIAAIRKGEKILSARLQAATIFLGIVFLVIKYFEWSAKIASGIYPDSPVLLNLGRGETLFFGLYYVMTGLHGLHVLVGIAVIAFMVHFTRKGTIGRENDARLENTGLYWHFVDIVWIYLYPLFYLVT
ncbi:MAG: Cytochrome bo(3) ubiquinol oxidase subunit 3 [Syntrophaceae bacterium PtaU1.Bin231]|nr:MAG: Cytochrome bo(3) ubiquinol oxidase subunit 3 [Syntrophaceae bacterium PtaU1.Bin231]